MHFLPVLLLFLSAQALAAEKPLVFVSVLPQTTIVKGIAGDLVQVEAIVGKGFNPATYQPSPRQIARLSDAVLYVRAGMPFEQSWLPRFLAVNPSMRVLDMRKGLKLLPAHGHHAGEEDPHVWTDPLLVKRHAQYLRDTLSELYPAEKRRLERNYRQFATRLDELDRELKAMLTPVEGGSFLVYHPAWSYFAHRYGLRQIAVEQGGKEPNPRTLAQLIETARKAKIHTVLVQPQHSSATAKVLAEAIGANLLEMDPLAPDFFSALRKLAAALARQAS
ncbi:metal ABC transporter solute-binding protein, Zn/Mn family [Thiolapillus sp.]